MHPGSARISKIRRTIPNDMLLFRICAVRTVCEQHPCQPNGERIFLTLFIDLRMPTRFAAVGNHGHSRKNYTTIR
jgi:hypothetical protein